MQQSDGTLALLPGQSLALRRLVDAMRADEAIYTACPDMVRSALAEILLPPYTSAEDHVRALMAAHTAAVQRLEQFGQKIRDQQAEISKLKLARVHD